MSQSEGSKQGNGKKRKTDAGDVVGWIGAIWCIIAIIWQPLDFFGLHGYQVIAEALGAEYRDISLMAAVICGMNMTIYIVALAAIRDACDNAEMTAGAHVLMTIIAIIIARLALLLYASISNQVLVTYYAGDNPVLHSLYLLIWFILSLAVISAIWKTAIGEFQFLFLGRKS